MLHMKHRLGRMAFQWCTKLIDVMAYSIAFGDKMGEKSRDYVDRPFHRETEKLSAILVWCNLDLNTFFSTMMINSRDNTWNRWFSTSLEAMIINEK